MTAAVVAPVLPAVTIRPAPRREPPFDDEIVDVRALPGPYDRSLPFELPQPPSLWPAGPHSPRATAEVVRWARRLLIGLIEAAGSRRPLHQLAGMVSGPVIRGLGGDFERGARAGSPHWLHGANPRTVRASRVSDGVVEVCATVEVGSRVRAVALRAEAQHGRWMCTRLQLG
jgi:hypothetical protein